MTGGEAQQAGQGQFTGQVRSPAAGYVSYLDPSWATDERQALALLSSVLTAPHGSAIFAMDAGGAILAWSESASGVFGYRPRAVLGQKKWADLADGRGPQSPQQPEPLTAALREGAWHGLQQFTAADGRQLVCQVAVRRLPGEEGQPAGLLALAQEATGDARRLASLESAAAEAVSLFSGNPIAVVGTDPLGVITHLNRSAEVLLGFSRRDLAGKRLAACFTQPEEARAVITRTLRDGMVRDAELEAVRADGTTVPVGLSAATYPGRRGGVAGLVASLGDQTERRRRREKLRRSEAYQRRLVEAAADGLVAVDAAGLVTDVNEPACDLFGFRHDELAGSPLAECFADPRAVTAAVERALAGEPLHHREFPLAAGNGRPRQVSLSASVFRSPGTGEPRVILSLHDVTEQAALRDRLDQERGYNRSIIESSANGLATIDLRDRISDVNETFCRVSGRSRGDLIGTDFAAYFTEPAAVTSTVHKALAAGVTVTRELRLADGGPQVSMAASPVRSAVGEVMGILTSTRDISEQSRLQRALAAEQAYNRALIDSSLSGLFVITRTGRVIDVNSEASRLTGHPRGRLLGRSFRSLFEDPRPAGDAIRRAFARGKMAECRLVLAPGPPRTIVSVSGGVFTDPRSRSDVLLAVMRDVTEAAQDEARRRFYTESLFEAIADAFAATDVLGVIVDANQSMEALVGHSLAEMAGHHLDEYFTEQQRARDFMSAVLREGKVTDYELTAARPDGSTTVVSYSAATYTDSEGKVQGMLASGRDVTDRKKFEELQASLLERARELDQAKTNFVSRISHELRSPLTSVLGYLELLGGGEPGPLTKEQRRMLEVINRNGRRLLSLIEDLLLLSRIEAGTISLTWEKVQLDDLVRSVHDSFARAIAQGKLTSRLDIEPGVAIDGDSRQLERVAVNLVSNAVKFTPPGGTIDIAVRQDGDDALVEVADTGVGIAEEDQPHLFNRFYRSAMATEREMQGTGLGLYIVKHITEAHGGTVTVRSSPGAGATFTVRLPAGASVRPRPAGREVTL